LDFGSGANTFNCTLSKCLNQCKNVDKTVLSCGDTFSTQNGNDPNKTLDGINDLIGDPPDVFVSPGKYQDGSNPSLIKTDSRSVATAAVWDSCSNPIDPGKEQKIQILGFVDIFVGGAEQSPCAKTGSNDAVVTGYLVSAGSCASAGGGGGAPAGAAGGVPIRLVQVPQS
jgi:hypothetical protein